MLRLLFITLFLIIPFIINAEHAEAFIYKNIYKNTPLITGNGKSMFNMRKDDSIMWYYNFNNTRVPACKFNTLNSNIDYLDVKTWTGDSYNKRICIKANSILWYFDMINNNESEEELFCHWKDYKLNSNDNISNINASCNRQGCLTKFGWVKNQYIC